jgi:hypothetical protein
MRVIALLIVTAAVLAPAQADAQEYGRYVTRLVGYNSDGGPRYGRFFCNYDGECHRVTRSARRYRHATRVYSYVRRDDDDDDRGVCREMRRVVGDQHLTVDGAKKAANDAWAGTVRFHLGEKFMDLGNARRITYTCSRSSIKEGGVTTLGQTLTRCEVEAQPCAAARTADTDK